MFYLTYIQNLYQPTPVPYHQRLSKYIPPPKPTSYTTRMKSSLPVPFARIAPVVVGGLSKYYMHCIVNINPCNVMSVYLSKFTSDH
jgi:hypothetical protein